VITSFLNALNGFHSNTTYGSLAIQELYNRAKHMEDNHQHAYHLLTSMQWSQKHAFDACVLGSNKDFYGIEIANKRFVLHATTAYKRWEALREIIESKNIHAFVFWLHRLFFFDVPFL
jgi:hypothetical protein